MAEEAWHEARLIPTSGISGAEEQERRATSALLAVLTAVKEFGRGLTQPLGAPAGGIQTFIEVPFMLGDKRLYPDGLIRVSRGQRSWTACTVRSKLSPPFSQTSARPCPCEARCASSALNCPGSGRRSVGCLL